MFRYFFNIKGWGHFWVNSFSIELLWGGSQGRSISKVYPEKERNPREAVICNSENVPFANVEGSSAALEDIVYSEKRNRRCLVVVLRRKLGKPFKILLVTLKGWVVIETEKELVEASYHGRSVKNLVCGMILVNGAGVGIFPWEVSTPWVGLIKGTESDAGIEIRFSSDKKKARFFFNESEFATLKASSKVALEKFLYAQKAVRGLVIPREFRLNKRPKFSIFTKYGLVTVEFSYETVERKKLYIRDALNSYRS